MTPEQHTQLLQAFTLLGKIIIHTAHANLTQASEIERNETAQAEAALKGLSELSGQSLLKSMNMSTT